MGIGLSDRFDAGRRGRVLAVQTELAQFVGPWPADVERAAAGEQTAGESFEPVEAAIEGARGRSWPAVSEKTEAMRADEGLIDIHSAIDEDAIAQAAAGIDEQRADAACRTFV